MSFLYSHIISENGPEKRNSLHMFFSTGLTEHCQGLSANAVIISKVNCKHKKAYRGRH